MRTYTRARTPIGRRGPGGRGWARRLLVLALGAVLLATAPASTASESRAAAAPEVAQQPRAFRLQEATIEDIHRAFQSRQLTATQLVQLYLNRIEAYNGRCVDGEIDAATGYQLGPITPRANAGQVNALSTLNIRGKRSLTDPIDNDPGMPDALQVARNLDARFAATGQRAGPLHGIPIAIKDQFDTRDMRSTSGAVAAYANDRPPRDAEIVARLRAAGAIILAKANMGEYAAGDRSTFGGTTCNPYDTTRSAGRSSGGSSAAVAANLVTCAIGEETGPSARNPAANTNTVGIVATHSLVSRAGLIPASITRDRAGVLCRTARDASIVLNVIAGYDPRDPVTAASIGERPRASYASFTERPSLSGVRIGVVRDFMRVPTDADRDSVRVTEQAIADLARGGATIVDPVDVQTAINVLVPSLEPSALQRAGTAIRDDAFVASPTPPTLAELVRYEADAGAVPTTGPGSVDFRRLSDSAFALSLLGETQFVLNTYLAERGDPNIRSVQDLLDKSVFYQFPYVLAHTVRTVVDGRVTDSRTIPADGITFPADVRLMDALFRTEDLVNGNRRRVPIESVDPRGVNTRRTTLQAILNKVMADNNLDALVYPTKTIPAPILGAPPAPVVDGRPPLAWTLSPLAGVPTITVPAGFTREVYDWAPPPVLTQEIQIDGRPATIRVYDPDQWDPRRFEGPKPIAVPVGLDIMGRPFSEPTLLKIAAAYDSATRHRRAPAGFPPLRGEP